MKKQKKKRNKPFSYFLYDFAKVTAGPPGLIAFRPKTWYENKAAKKKIRGGALLIANHLGATDPIVLMISIWYRRHHFICLKEILRTPVKNWLFRRFHCIPIDRENFGMDSLRDIVAHLKDEKLVCMFPEGHVTAQASETDTFKSGMVLMSVMSKKPIIPVYIAPQKHWYNRVHLIMGEPIDIVAKYGSMPSLKQIEIITKELHECEDRLQKELTERRSKK